MVKTLKIIIFFHSLIWKLIAISCFKISGIYEMHIQTGCKGFPLKKSEFSKPYILNIEFFCSQISSCVTAKQFESSVQNDQQPKTYFWRVIHIIFLFVNFPTIFIAWCTGHLCPIVVFLSPIFYPPSKPQLKIFHIIWPPPHWF